MKSVPFYAFAALIFRIVHAHPQATTEAIYLPPLPAVAATPYPASPTTHEFKYLNYDEDDKDDKQNRKLVHDGFQDFSPVLKAAIESLDNTDDKTFDRWFQDEVLREDKDDLDGRTYVKGVLKQVYSPSDDTPTKAVKNFVCLQNDQAKNCKPDVRAYTISPRFHFCPLGLKQTTKASDVKCPDLGDADSEKMNSITGTIIHEFMHQRAAIGNAPHSLGHIGDEKYGPVACQQYNKGPKKNKTFVNADRYKWFALNAYYNKVCDKQFKDAAITQEDLEAGQAELINSNEYHEADTSEPLAGV